MTTRMPSPDADCSPEGRRVLSSNRWGEVRYSLELIKLASTVRELVDARLSEGGWRFGQLVEERFCQLAASLSADMRIEAPFYTRDWPTKGKSPFDDDLYADHVRQEKDRWFLHQALFHAYLELQSHADDAALTSHTSVTLARHILDISDRIRNRCAVVDSFRVNSSASLKACSVLLMAELASNTGFLSRCVLTSRIEGVLRKCDTTKTHQEASIVRALLERMRTTPPLTPPTSSGAPERDHSDSAALQHQQQQQSHSAAPDGPPQLATMSQQALLAAASSSVLPDEIYDWQLSMPSDTAVSPGFLVNSLFEGKMHSFEDLFPSAIDPSLQPSNASQRPVAAT